MGGRVTPSALDRDTAITRADQLRERSGEVIDRFRFPLTRELATRFAEALRAPADTLPPTVLQCAALYRNVVPHLALGLERRAYVMPRSGSRSTGRWRHDSSLPP